MGVSYWCYVWANRRRDTAVFSGVAVAVEDQSEPRQCRVGDV